MRSVKAAIIGFGGIARSHSTGYKTLTEEGIPVRLVAVCDILPAQFTSELSINIETGSALLPKDIHTYTSVDKLIANEDFDMADICLPTYLHAEYAVKLLRAGKHVLSEKPMALTTEQCDAMLAVARETGKKLMIGQCLRFGAAYRYLKECAEDGRHGALRHLFMERRCAQPRWGYEHWFEDTEKSGGCILDMHIHDVDMARFLLGEPQAVSTVSLDRDVRWQVENTRLYYEGMLVVIDASWDEAATTPFRSGYRARFENATLISDGHTVTLYPDVGKVLEVALPNNNPYITEELRAFVGDLLADRLDNPENSAESARDTVRLIEALRVSAAHGGEIIKLEKEKKI